MSKKACAHIPSVYRLCQPERYSNETIDMMVTLLENVGPKPMRNLKPTEKKPTAADQFDKEHHQPYEAMAPAADRIATVHEHNMAYPKLRDELEKRRSIACVAKPMLKTLKLQIKKKKTAKRAIQKRDNPKKREKKYTFSLAKIKINRGCQSTFKTISKGTQHVTNLNRFKNIDYAKSNTRTVDSVSIATTSENCLPSDRSGLSLDHEPMVS